MSISRLKFFVINFCCAEHRIKETLRPAGRGSSQLQALSGYVRSQRSA
jgi:hypothetical protein